MTSSIDKIQKLAEEASSDSVFEVENSPGSTITQAQL